MKIFIFSVLLILILTITLGPLIIRDWINSYKGIILEVNDSAMNNRCGLKYKSMMEHPDFGQHYIYINQNVAPSPDSTAKFAFCYFQDHQKAKALSLHNVYYKYSSECAEYGKPLVTITKMGNDSVRVAKPNIWSLTYTCKIVADSCHCDR
jgi:hypothetical protein